MQKILSHLTVKLFEHNTSQRHSNVYIQILLEKISF